MTTHVIESIGRHGVRSTNVAEIRHRLERPRPGDIVDFGENVGTYPFTYGRFGRLSNVETGLVGKGEAMVCCEMGSAFLNDDGTVSISGGPFKSFKLTDLEPLYSLKWADVWNWGDNSPGAGQGVHYSIPRPVFRLRKLGGGARPTAEEPAP